MSIASPTLRSSSSTLPWPSCSSCATERLARPSTAEMFTGTSNTGARSLAVFSSPSPTGVATMPSGPNSSSFRSVSSAMRGLVVEREGRIEGERLGVQALGGERAFEGLGDAPCGGGRIERGRAVAPVEDEGGAGELGVVAHHDLAGVADRLGGLGDRGGGPLGQRRRDAQHQ